MNTTKQVNIMVALIFLSVLATGAYTIWDPTRASDAEGVQAEKQITYGAWLFQQNCRICHGNQGEGGAAANRLRAAPPLNRPFLRGEDEETGEVDATNRSIQFDRVFYTITCGRVGTAMPNWGQTQGGPLNDEQIRQLARFITEGGDEGWEQAEEFALHGKPSYELHGDLDSPLRLARPLDDSATEVFLRSIDEAVDPGTAVGPGVRLEIGEELMLITDIDKEAKSVTVERGLGSTSPEAHEADALVVTPPVPADPPSVTGATCGQNAGGGGSALSDCTPAPAPPPPAGGQSFTVCADGIQFDKDALSATAGSPITILFDNQETTPGATHNFVVYEGEDDTGTEVGRSEDFDDPAQDTVELGALAAGQYFFLCEFHPTIMTGALTVQ